VAVMVAAAMVPAAFALHYGKAVRLARVAVGESHVGEGAPTYR